MVIAMIDARHATTRQDRSARAALRRSSALSLILGLGLFAGTAAHGQAFNATPTNVNGAVITDSGPTTEIAVTGPEAIIDWAFDNPGGAEYLFQAAGTEASFFSGTSGADNFTVLNRITPSAGAPLLRMEGIVSSSNVSGQGGTIWFSTPGGFILGANASFNVGSLLLTTSGIDTTGGLYGPNGEIRLTGAAATSRIVIENGASINAMGGDINGLSSYVAIVAPRIEQGGTIAVTGSTALVAAEQATLRFNAGLFDVDVQLGSEDANGIVHSGSTGGPATASGSDVQRVTMVAVPKNDAMTMLLAGTIGYEAATVPTQEGSAVQLSAGYNWSGETAGTRASSAPANIRIENASFTSRVGEMFGTPALASGAIDIAPTGTTQFLADANLLAGERLGITANAGSSIRFDGAATLSAADGLTGGTIDLLAGPAAGTLSAGTIDVAGSLTLDASASPYAFAFTPTSGVNATGGTVTVDLSGGTLTAGNLDILASASGMDAIPGGTAQGGTVALTVRNGGQLTSNMLSVYVDGAGGWGMDGIGGNATGGRIDITDLGGALNLDSLYLNASARGGSGNLRGGDARSGQVAFALNGQTQTWASLNVEANAYGGDGGFSATDPLAGNAQGDADAIRLEVSGTGHLILGDAFFAASGEVMPSTGSDGFARGGGITLLARNGGTLTINGQLTATASGSASSDFTDLVGNVTPMMQGGSILLGADGGAIDATRVMLSADARGTSAFDTAGMATAGAVTISATNGGSFTIAAGSADPGLFLSAVATGASGQAGADATGGTARIVADGGTISVEGQTVVDASGRMPESYFARPGTASVTGGTASVDLVAGAMTFQSLQILAEGDGRFSDGALPFFDASDGSAGIGGTASLTATAGTLIADNLVISGNGWGGDTTINIGGTAGFVAGAGTGGRGALLIAGGDVSLGTLQLTALGTGGSATELALSGSEASSGGAGFGGVAELSLTGGTLGISAGELDLLADGIGGAAGGSEFGAAGFGGAAGGGTASLTIGGLSTLALDRLALSARALGGTGGISDVGLNGNGGNAVAGDATVQLGDGGFALGPLQIAVDAIGGDGATGGNATAGNALFDLTDAAILANPALGTGLSRQIASLAFDASATAGTGSAADGTSQAGTVIMTVRAGAPAAQPMLSGSLTAIVTGDSPAGPGNAFTLITANTPFAIGSDMTVTTIGNVAVQAGTGADLIVANDLLFSTPGSISGTGRTRIGGNGQFSGGSGILFDAISAGGDATFLSPDGAIGVTSDLAVGGQVTAAGRAIAFTALGNTSYRDLTASAGDISLRNGGAIQLTGIVTADAGGISLTSGGGLAAGGAITSAEGVTVDSGGDIQLTGPVIADAGDISLTSDGNISLSDDLTASAGDVLFVSGGDIDLAGSITGSRALDVSAVGNVRFAQDAMAGTMSVQAADLVIEPAATLGSLAQTSTIAITLTPPGGQAFIGGDATGPGLSATELGRLFATDAIDITLAGPAQNLQLGTFTLNGQPGGNLGPQGRFSLTAPSAIIVTGTVDYNIGSADAILSLTAGQVIVQADTGRIALLNDAGASQGRLLIDAGTILVGDSATLSAIDGLTDLSAISALLDTPPAGSNPAPALIAGHIGLTVGNAVLIQNLGASDGQDDRQGFLAGSVAIDGTGTPIAIAINGQIITADGTMATGFDSAAFVSINGVAGNVARSGFQAFSSINGCIIGLTCGPGGPLPVPLTKDVLVRDALNGADEFLNFPQPPIGYGVMPLFETEPLLDEPVTGVGNEDLWEDR